MTKQEARAVLAPIVTALREARWKDAESLIALAHPSTAPDDVAILLAMASCAARDCNCDDDLLALESAFVDRFGEPIGG